LTPQIKESAARVVFLAAACVSIAAVVVICLFLFANGLPFIAKTGLWSFIGGKIWKPTHEVFGIFPMVVGSIYVTSGALVIGVPVGVLTAMYLVFFVSARSKKILSSVVSLLAGIPSVVFGFFGLVVIVPFIRNNFGGNGSSILTASILLGIMILPTIISVSVSSLEAVPSSYFEGSLALGVSKEQSVFFAVVPAARSGITASIILGTGRAIGETMAVIMVAGNQARIPSSLLKGVRTLTANVVIEMGYATGLHREALIATAVVLFVFILLINLLFSVLKNRRVQ